MTQAITQTDDAVKDITFVAGGDAFITRKTVRDEAFSALAAFVDSADVGFCNLETTFASALASPAAISGGTWARSSPHLVDDLQGYGFNLVACATNHAYDYGEQGLVETLEVLTRAGLANAGAGTNLHEASRATMIETPAGRVALIALTSSFQESAIAGAQRTDIKGRPGVNPLRHTTTYALPKDLLDQLRSIGDISGINQREAARVKEGYARAANDVDYIFGGHRFVESETPAVQTRASDQDMQRTLAGIRDAATMADYVLVSIHSHEMAGKDKAAVPAFLQDFARACIDAGAHAVIGHGPHILRGIEIHKGRPIFYSLGNFIFQNETVDVLPSDFYEKYGLDPGASVPQAFDARTEGGKKGLAMTPGVWHSVMPRWTMRSGRLTSLTLHPISLGYGLPRWARGTPCLSQSLQPLQELQSLSQDFGTSIRIDSDGIGIVELPAQD